MPIFIKSSQEFAPFAADRVTNIAQRSVAARGRFLFALSGGGTPRALFQRLAQTPERIPWERTHVFWGDERMVPFDNPGSNFGEAKKILLDHVPIPVKNIHPVNTTLSPAAAALDYSQQLGYSADSPLQLDLALLGLGTDGHTASLFPASDPDTGDALALAVSADYGGRPAHRVTLTPRVFNLAREILFLVSGEDKAPILAAVLEGDPDPVRVPAQRIRPISGALSWIVDEAAASLLSKITQ